MNATTVDTNGTAENIQVKSRNAQNARIEIGKGVKRMQNPEVIKKGLKAIFNMSVQDIISKITIDTNGEWVLGVKFTTALRVKQLQLLESIIYKLNNVVNQIEKIGQYQRRKF